MTTPGAWTDHAGVIHLHSVHSFDGRRTVPEIIAAANDSGIDFLMLTDHASLQARAEGLEGWQGRTLLVVGEEISPRFNHYLAFGLSDPVSTTPGREEMSPQTCIDRIAAGGGIGFIAHPDHGGTERFHVKRYPWTDWSVTGYTGLGIWDFMTDWQRGLTGYGRALIGYAFPSFLLRGPLAATLTRWDRLTRERRVVGIGELDNHDTLYRVLGLKLPVFPFRRVFRLIRTHVLTEAPFTGDGPADIASLLQALRSGHAYVSLDSNQDARGFRFTLTEGTRTATMGDEFCLADFAELAVSFPANARIRIIRNGSLLHQRQGTTLSERVREPGIYRIEADLRVFGRYRPWIFSNPIYVSRSLKRPS
jgi:hypothetical protein